MLDSSFWDLDKVTGSSYRESDVGVKSNRSTFRNKEKFDIVKGVGDMKLSHHTIGESRNLLRHISVRQGWNWTFGLLCRGVKYVKKNAFIRIGGCIPNLVRNSAWHCRSDRFAYCSAIFWSSFKQSLIYDGASCRRCMCYYAHFSVYKWTISNFWMDDASLLLSLIRKVPWCDTIT